MPGLESKDLHVVTGAFGYSGRYMARRLLDAGRRVRTLTNSPRRENPFGGKVEVRPYDFDDPDRLVSSLRKSLRSTLVASSRSTTSTLRRCLAAIVPPCIRRKADDRSAPNPRGIDPAAFAAQLFGISGGLH